MLTLVLALMVAPPEVEPRFDPPPIETGWGLRESWDGVWRRFQDRHGRPDPQGPLWQWAPETQDSEYELTLAAAEHPLALERDWTNSTRGARVFVHSDDEFSFYNGVRIKERVRMGRAGALGLRFDRLELAGIHSSLVQLIFAFPDIAGSGAFIELRPIARFEKPDLDLELAFGWAREGVARLTGRVFSFDCFNNASDALAKQRNHVQDIRVLQLTPSFGVAAELELFDLGGLTGAIFMGSFLPSPALVDHADEILVDFRRTWSGGAGGMWLEWALPRVPAWVGASTQMLATRQLVVDLDGVTLSDTREREVRSRAYVLARVAPGTRWSTQIEVAGSHRIDESPQHRSPDPDKPGSVVRDQSWLGMARATWMPTRVFGLELTWLTLDREAEGEGALPEWLTKRHSRVVTRFALAFDPNVRVTFGVGWDVDDAGNRYDKGGMTLSARW